ncbi:MAG TPA: TonB-dependent receptor [Candidatus Kapabacteria bacterium]|nr:TonB-dependent receptor [Candidatus Kapabacteria bacterium]
MIIGAVFVRVSAIGYTDTIIDFGKRLFIEILLTPQKKRIDEIVITAERHATASQDVPVSISVVKPAELLSRGSFAIDNALRWIPGISVTESQVNIRGSSGYGRGVGSRVLFLLDGMPLLAADNGDIKFDVVPMLDIERIEVVKGAGSALYGSSALGGVINVISRVPADTSQTAITLLTGMYDKPKYSEWEVPTLNRRFVSLEAGSSGMIGSSGILGTITLRRNEGYRLGDDSYKEGGFIKLISPLASTAKLSSSLLIANEDHGGWLYWKSLSLPLLPADSLGALNGRIHSFKANMQSSLDFISEQTSQTVRADVYYTKFSTDPSKQGDPVGPHSAGINATAEYDINSDINPFFISGGIITSFQNITSDAFGDHHGISFAGFGQGEWRIDPIILTAGFRADAIRYDANMWMSSLSPKLGITYKPYDDLSFRASLGSGFRAPTMSEQFVDQVFTGFPVKPNLDLVPERSYSTEAGLTYRNRYILLDGAIFYSGFDHLIEPTFISTGTTSYIQFQNITKAEIYGHEEVVEWMPLGDDRLAARLGYTYVYPHNKVTGGVLEFRPRHLFQVRLSTAFGNFEASSDFRYISKYESLDSVLIRQVPDGDARVNAYVLDARVGYNLNAILRVPAHLTFQIENLLNYYYVEIVGNLAPLRSYSLRIETVF